MNLNRTNRNRSRELKRNFWELFKVNLRYFYLKERKCKEKFARRRKKSESYSSFSLTVLLIDTFKREIGIKASDPGKFSTCDGKSPI